MAKPVRPAKLSKDSSFKETIRVVGRYLEDIDTPVSLATYLMVKYQEFDQLITRSIDPSWYTTAYEFSLDYQAVELLKKADFLPTSVDRREVAIGKFMEAEEKCKRTNDRLIKGHLDPEFTPERAQQISFVAAEIGNILGRSPNPNELRFGFGPGASGSCSGIDITIGDKLSAPLAISRWAIPLFERIKNLPHLIAASLNIENVEGPFTALGAYTLQCHNTLTTVPKNSKTDRCICIEPHLNIFLQKGYGNEIRRKLKYHGLDLDNQAAINAALACKGSIDGSFATIDLSSASDTISYMLILNVLPKDWFEVLDQLRSPATLVNEQLIINEKFSSMGNGFTFELETLLFYAISCVIAKQHMIPATDIHVFGDDIIVPTVMAADLIDFLEFLGFSTNKDKTFLAGNFRESCGKDYFSGTLVRPYYIKELPRYETDFIKIANGIRKFAYRFNHNGYCDKRFYRSWSLCVRAIPERLRSFGPLELGDCCLWSSRQEAKGMYRYKDHTFWTRILETVPNKKRLSSFHGSCQRAAVLYGASFSLPLRGTVGGFRQRDIPVPYWDWNEGSWI